MHQGAQETREEIRLQGWAVAAQNIQLRCTERGKSGRKRHEGIIVRVRG